MRVELMKCYGKLRPARPLILLLILLLSACEGENNSTPTVAPESREQSRKPVPVPRFEVDSAYHYVDTQVAFGPRVVNSPEHRATRSWLVEKLKEFGGEVTEQNFSSPAYTGELLEGTNIIARFEPNLSNRILLCAHWDTRHIADSELNTGDVNQPVDGADDGASGVGVLLEVARQLGQAPPGIGVDIVLLDAEDHGEADGDNMNSWGLGAQYYSSNLPPRKPRYGVLLDMVGAKDARFTVEEVSEYFAPEVRKKVWKLAKQMGYGNYFVEDQTRAVTDDHLFINRIAGIPTIDIINRPADSPTGFVAHWHTNEDDMDVIDKQTLRTVGQLVLAVVYREAGGTL